MVSTENESKSEQEKGKHFLYFNIELCSWSREIFRMKWKLLLPEPDRQVITNTDRSLSQALQGNQSQTDQRKKESLMRMCDHEEESPFWAQRPNQHWTRGREPVSADHTATLSFLNSLEHVYLCSLMLPLR